MAVVSIKSNASRPLVAELVARATAIAPFIRAEAEQTESNRQVSAEAMARLREAGLFRVMTPAIYGGYEYGFDAMIRVAAPIGAACGSTGWVFSLAIVHQWLAAMFPKQAQDEFWSNPDALLFGSYPPVAKVVPNFAGGPIRNVWIAYSGFSSPHSGRETNRLVKRAKLPAAKLRCRKQIVVAGRRKS